MRSVGLLLLACLAAGCGGSVTALPPSGADHEVNAVGVTSWNPTPITIKAGENVAFRNSSSTLHNVQFDQATVGHPGNVSDFASSSKSVTFPTAGTYTFFCAIHPFMTGKITATS